MHRLENDGTNFYTKVHFMAQKASKVDPKILEPAIEKQKSAAISTQVHSPYSK